MALGFYGSNDESYESFIPIPYPEGHPDDGKSFAMEADLTVYWPFVRECWEEEIMNDIKRDSRWENLSATVSHYFPVFDDGSEPDEPIVEFLIEVTIGDKVLFSRQLVSEDDLKMYSELFGVILDHMVEIVDEHLEEAGFNCEG